MNLVQLSNRRSVRLDQIPALSAEGLGNILADGAGEPWRIESLF